MSFETLGLARPLLKVLERQGFTKPTPIQEQSIPLVIRGQDIIGLAQTGTGKTAAFTLPVLHLLCSGVRSGKFRPVRMLVLSPTRELAAQVERVIKDFASAVNLKSVPIFGGVPFFRQVQALRKGTDILVCTPGRLEDHISQKTLDLSRVSHLVLDEADQMLDIGFLPAIKRIIAFLPKKKQTLLFSATMPKEIRKLTADYLNNPAEVAVTPIAKPADKIYQQVIFLSKSEKLNALKDLVCSRQGKKILIFARTKHGADKVVNSLTKVGFKIDAIHGNKSQVHRQRALENFRKGKCLILIATDIAARGIDVQDVELVVNYDLPDVPETYIHRIGRTARAGASGQAISFCTENEIKNLAAIEKLISIQISNFPLDGKETTRPPINDELNTKKPIRKRMGRVSSKMSELGVSDNVSRKKMARRFKKPFHPKHSLSNKSGESSLTKKNYQKKF